MTGQTEQRRSGHPLALRVLRTIGKIILAVVALLVVLGIAELLINRLRGYQVVTLKTQLAGLGFQQGTYSDPTTGSSTNPPPPDDTAIAFLSRTAFALSSEIELQTANDNAPMRTARVA